MFHPIRWTKRKLRSTTGKVVAVLMLTSTAGTGTTAVMAPDSVPGQVGHQMVRVLEYGVDTLTGSAEGSQQ